MQTIFDIIVPIFALIALGYASAHVKLLSDDVGSALAKFVFTISVPILLFRSLASADFGDANPAFLWISYFLSAALVWTLSTLAARWVFRSDHRTGVIAGVSAAFANTVFVALPTLQRAYGDDGIEPLLLIIAIHLPIMMIACTVMVERAVLLDARETGTEPTQQTGFIRTCLRTGRTLSTNPIVIGIACGLVWRATGLQLERHLDEITRLLSSIAGPTALFALGMSLTRYGLRGDLGLATIVAMLSLVVQPGLVFLIGTEIGLTDLWLKGAVVTAAAPAGVNAYLFAAYFRTGEKLAATCILWSTILSVVTLSFWLSVLDGV